jgi:flagellar assembly factor FliW
MAQTENGRLIRSRVGSVQFDPERVISFPRGIIGFEGEKRFFLVQLKDDSPFLVLQSISDPGLGLLVADPFSFLQDYEVKLSTAEQKLLKLKSIKQVAVLVTVNIPPQRPERTALNLSGPIIINYEARIGLQVPQVDMGYPSRAYINDMLAE